MYSNISFVRKLRKQKHAKNIVCDSVRWNTWQKNDVVSDELLYLRKPISTIENTGKVNNTKQLLLSSVVLFLILIPFAAIIITKSYQRYINATLS